MSWASEPSRRGRRARAVWSVLLAVLAVAGLAVGGYYLPAQSATFRPSPLPVVGDATHLTNVLMTLFDNALKHGRLGGKIQLWGGVRGSSAVVQLTNEGATIPPQCLGRVFEKLFRVPTGNRHDVPGYGLGLHYAQAVVRHHGGTIAVRSQNE